jgi:hypothetical protein
MYIEQQTSDVLHKKSATWDRDYAQLPRIPKRQSSQNSNSTSFMNKDKRKDWILGANFREA